MGVNIVYNSGEMAERIKALVKEKNISVKRMLEEANLASNTISHMKTSMPISDNLAKIADYLGVSMDYLLGRTEDRGSLSEHEKEVLAAYRKRREMQDAVDKLLGIE